MTPQTSGSMLFGGRVSEAPDFHSHVMGEIFFLVRTCMGLVFSPQSYAASQPASYRKLSELSINP